MPGIGTTQPVSTRANCFSFVHYVSIHLGILCRFAAIVTADVERGGNDIPSAVIHNTNVSTATPIPHLAWPIYCLIIV